MSYTVYWTPQAEQTFIANLEYLEKSWTNAVINDFLDRVEEVLQTLRESPYIYSLHREQDGVRKCVVNERIVLFFIINEETITLLSFWNTYQDPQNLFL
ncbi:MAG: type II toxin-antitoxin system RelE/ParE family toxin [Bacteroidetes bacterium]|nr:type II toxin-antitoxin system RelE/ParE family toxin [Bacteroidota bacterium]